MSIENLYCTLLNLFLISSFSVPFICPSFHQPPPPSHLPLQQWAECHSRYAVTGQRQRQTSAVHRTLFHLVSVDITLHDGPFTFMWPCIVTNFFIIKPTRCTNFTNLLRHETLHVSGSSSSHHQEFIHCALSTVICHTVLKTAFKQDQRSCLKAVFKTVWHIPVLSAQWINSWWWEEELPETCRVSCRSKFVKLVHLVGFIIKKIDGPVCTNYTGCHRRKGPNFGRVFLMLNYTDITQNTYIQSWTVTEIMAREVWNFDSCYTLTDYQIHIETGRNMWFL